MSILLPINVKNDYISYSEILNQIPTVSIFEPKVTFNFIQCRFIEGNLTALISMLGHRFIEKGQKVSLENISRDITNLFYKNAFSDRLSLPKSESEEAMSLTSIPYRETPTNDESFGDYIYEQLLENPYFPKLTESSKDLLCTAIFELYANAITHANAKQVFTCGQIYPKIRVLTFSIGNLGTTIEENVNKFLYQQTSMSANNSIEWALKYQNSTKSMLNNEPGGLGLYILEQYLILVGGKLQIVSGHGFYEHDYTLNKKISKNLKHPLPGTIITLTIDLKERSKNKEEIIFSSTNSQEADIIYKSLINNL